MPPIRSCSAARRNARIASPLGTMLLARTERGLAGAWFEAARSTIRPRSTRPSAPTIRCSARRDAARGLFRRRRATASTCRSTCKARRSSARCGSELLRIGRGTTCSYGDIARRARHADGEPRGRRRGRPQSGLDRSCRAIASSAAHGALTGYAGGLDRKTALLRIEAARVAATQSGARQLEIH